MIRKAYRIPKAGNIAQLKMVEEELSAPKPDEVQVEVKAVGLNFADVFAILGLYSATPEGSFVPGLEYSGVITAVGAEVSDKKPGDKIMGVTRFGAYASHLNIDHRYVQPLPDGWSMDEGAAYLVQGLTAYYGLFKLGNLQKGQNVLIHSGAGGVGLLANRMAKKMEAYTIGTIGSPAKNDLLIKEGYNQVIVRGKDFKNQLSRALNGKPLHLIMESIGGEVMKAGYDQLTQQGRMVIFGSARYGSRTDKPNWPKLVWQYLTRPKIDPQKMIELNKGLLGFNLIWLYHQTDLMLEIIKEMKELNLEPPLIGHRYSFDDLPKAIRYFQSGNTVGKVVIQL